jgi:hypothetical protein
MSGKTVLFLTIGTAETRSKGVYMFQKVFLYAYLYKNDPTPRLVRLGADFG